MITAPSPRVRHSLLAAFASLAAVSVAQAATYYWDADGATPGFTASPTGTWGTSTFWSTDSTGSTAGANTTITSADDVNFGSATSGVVAASSTVTISGTQNVRSITLGAGNTGGANSLTLSGGTSLTLGSGSTITNNSAQTLTINSLLAGTNGFTKAGTGSLILSNSFSSLTGAVTVAAGTLQYNAALSNTSSLAINSGANVVVASSAANLIGGTISWGGGLMQYNSTSGSDLSSQFSTAANQAIRVNLLGGAGTVTYGTALTSAGGSLTKSGTGILNLSAANTYTGTTTVSSGNLTLSNALALQNSAIDTSNSVTGAAGSGLILSGVTTPTIGGLTGTKALASLFDTSTGGYGSVTNLTLNPGTGVTNSYSGVIADGATGMSLTKTGAGTQTLTVANTYTGGTNINGGTLEATALNALGTTGTISFGGGVLKTNQTVDRSSRFSTAAGQAYNLENSVDVTWATALSSTGSSLTKSGTGTLTLSVSSTGGLSTTVTGPITVNAGALWITDGYSHKNSTGAITVASGATFNFGQNFIGGNNLTNNLTINGVGSGGAYGAFNLGANATASGTITLASAATISHDFNNGTLSGSILTGGNAMTLKTTVAGQPGLVVSGAITGGGALTVTGVANAGTYSVQLTSNSNSFSGGTTVTAGTLTTSSTGNFGTGNVTVQNGAFLNLGNASSIADSATLFFNKNSTAASISFTGIESLFTVSDTVTGTFVTAGTYTASQLNTFFTTSVFTGAGSVNVSVIPEPSTYAAFAGLLGMARAAVRRRKRALYR